MKLDKVINLAKEYETKYLKPNAENFEISEIYDLFPDQNTKQEYQKWPETYEHHGRCGVFLISAANEEVIYIGSASNNVTEGLGAYFGPDKKNPNKCAIKHGANWSKKPRYVSTIAVSEGASSQIESLKVELIKQAQPCENTRGK